MSAPNLGQPADLEQLARARFGPISDAETRLLRAVLEGEVAYCGPSGRDDDPNNDPANSDNWDSERWISAELIRWLCVDQDAKNRVDPRGIRLHAARIRGKLDLSFAVVSFFLGFLRCNFSDDLDLRFVEIPSLDLSGTCLPSLNADHATLKGSLLLRGLWSKGAVQLRNACIGGNLECDGGKFQNPGLASVAEGGGALNAEGAKVAGSVGLCDGFVAEGEVCLHHTEIGGNLACHGGTFQNPGRLGVVGGGIALEAANVKVRGDVFLYDRFVAEGMVRVFAAEIGGSLLCGGGKFQNPTRPDVDGSGIALEATNSQVGGDVFFDDGFVAEGMVRVFAAEIGGSLLCGGGKFQNPANGGVDGNGFALQAANAKVTGDVFFDDGFAAQGIVRLPGAQIAGSLVCRSGAFERLYLTDGSAGAIADDEKSWPKSGELFLDGFTYGRIAGGPVDATKRLEWLARQVPFTRHPYRQLARVLKEAGDDRGWRRGLRRNGTKDVGGQKLDLPPSQLAVARNDRLRLLFYEGAAVALGVGDRRFTRLLAGRRGREHRPHQ